MIDIHLQCLQPLTRLSAATVVDMGCGMGSVVRRLAALGAKAIGVEPDPNRLTQARRQRVVKRERYVEAQLDRLPLENASADLTLFLFSLRPLDSERQLRALAEAQRVLKPGGRLHVVEALAEGPYFQVLRLIEDQSESRKATLRTLTAIPELGFRPVMSVRYEHLELYADYDEFRLRMIATQPARLRAFETRDSIIRAAFEAQGEVVPGGVKLTQPVRMFHFAKPEVLQ